MLLRYTVMQCGAGCGALLRREPDGTLVQLARTDGWSPADERTIDRLWLETHELLACGEAQHRDEVLLWPLLDSERRLMAVAAFVRLREGQAPSSRHRDLFERLRVEATALLPRDPMRVLLKALVSLAPRLAMSRTTGA